ncbi:EPIDERMAL PATTERNING FACTOR-like protein 6 [Cucumis melo var. makuwa]|uniref:Epidermal patterning factor-like protein n=1 Tax=Cucumis melo var. makuwa TaxID=1194695 RepID=A0A5D3BE35_CUCMM|nr:EPIDERMAL PATTERNING FACTOR-like protein 6 [Cucumis melo var. makuwa]TYJ97264.1 EPIDERMAL PATTERNING FACTOR-like protein 6 [Cucumis melo var. makuwa]
MVFILSSFCSSIRSSSNGDSDNTRSCSFVEAVQYPMIANCEDQDQFMRLPRRGLGGPGSSPPRCTSKCGKCTPCTAVHVPVPPGTPVTAEYYPEAWRCKCGNKLYMP